MASANFCRPSAFAELEHSYDFFIQQDVFVTRYVRLIIATDDGFRFELCQIEQLLSRMVPSVATRIMGWGR